ncbi:MAG: tRNA pseudouridine(55) synthase TruB [Deltaproteobacteria bacterium]|nr:tRNA pseudouridine(55) synthase TruB [Deltaproteobacteria bacterium]MBW1719253.1 tRNA pseudouridine(55) synthase TruB [Deltaproteobacteria bacterium]MBW1931825.1 tRNA pseudouridine(55) synthase TruB [Deltaproteobacteria bacterium]MBW1937921.1 tRNA pseudouridine(55) synthase TruB [Deltaproteobacteria bacterium]MBW1964270.1 tRNA pseudouridine(55) synthase TruB [Deltaproteobacteria bacterium]
MLDGILVMDKASGITSFKMVQEVRKRLKVKKAGHAGTLDPLATGVLLICLGRATKIVQFIMAGHKVYQGTMLLGVATDTYDAAGKVTEQKPLPPCLDQISLQKVAQKFTGRLLQPPPPFSAAKHKGKPLYKFARQGIMVQKESRPVQVFSFEILEMRLPKVDFRVHCSKGTYVRSLVHDLGSNLGCGGHVTRLRRTRSGSFNIEHALKMETLDEILKSKRLLDVLVPTGKALAHIPAIEIDNEMATELRNGRPIFVNRLKELMESQGHGSDVELPYLRLLCRPPYVKNGSNLQEKDLVSVVAWPTAMKPDDHKILRPIKVWPKECGITN